MTYPSTTRRERFADTAVHAVSLLLVLAGCVVLMIEAASLAWLPMIACALYCLTLLVSFTVSAGYHLLPWHSWRPLFQRIDHAAIYALIAGTFTPLLVQIGSLWSLAVLGGVWLLSIPGVIYKLVARELEPRWSLFSYLGIGWFGLLALPEFGNRLPTTALVAIVIGGLTYTFGTIFYARKVQAYRYAIWHGFVLGGTALFYSAIWMSAFSA
ncbi:MAG: hemolysin III family protein [Nitratireductor sp.]|nr:hemolysin III family protein [Nitratireductor sp.]